MLICYSNLYKSQTTDAQDSFEIFTENMEIPKLDDAERDALDSPLTCMSLRGCRSLSVGHNYAFTER